MADNFFIIFVVVNFKVNLLTDFINSVKLFLILMPFSVIALHTFYPVYKNILDVCYNKIKTGNI